MTATLPIPVKPAPDRRRSTLAYWTVVGVLAVAAVGLNTVVRSMRLSFQKLPLPLAGPLDDPSNGIPSLMGSWVQITDDKPLNKDIEDSLGTKEYVFRVYANTDALPSGLVDTRDTQPERFRQQAVAAVATKPESIVHVAVTYYTGLVDTVPHVPERCYVADGYLPSEFRDVRWAIDGVGAVPLRVLDFEDQTGTGRIRRNVAYTFHVNGVFESDPLAVRGRLQNLLQRYGYFAKIELMTQAIDSDLSAQVMQSFLRDALPEITARMPDFSRLGVAGADDATRNAQTRDSRPDGAVK